MKIAVSATGSSLDSTVDPRFGRCAYFVVVDTDTMRFEAVPNTSQNAAHGAGIQAAQSIASKGVQVILTGNVGPNAFQALSAAGIQIISGASGTVKEAVEKFKEGGLKGTSSPTAPMHYGTGGGRGGGGGFGMGMGGGGGRGMGMGRGMGTGRGMGSYTTQTYPTTPAAPPMSTPQMTKEQEVQMLGNQMRLLQDQLDQVKKRLKELAE